jgi:hypothetical protein
VVVVAVLATDAGATGASAKAAPQITLAVDANAAVKNSADTDRAVIINAAF